MNEPRTQASWRWALAIAIGLVVASWWRFGSADVNAAELSFLSHNSWMSRLVDGWLSSAPNNRAARAPFAAISTGCLLLIGFAVVRARDASRSAFALLTVVLAPSYIVSSLQIGATAAAVALVSLVLGAGVLGRTIRRAGALTTLAALLCVVVAVRAEAPLSTRLIVATMALLTAAWSRSATFEPPTSRFVSNAALLTCVIAIVVVISPAGSIGSAALMTLMVLVTSALAVGAPSARAAVIVFAPLWVFGAASLLQLWRHDAPALPLAAALRSMSQERPQARELLVGAGITRGVASLAARESGWRVVDLPGEPWVGEISVGGRRPSARERSELERRLGHRVIDTYGAATNEQGSVGWAVHRPMAISPLPAIDLPDIAIVSIDTLRADHLPLYGYARDTAPQLTRWAQGAAVYEQARATASETVPSFASLLTGRFPAGHGVRGNTGYLLPGNWTLPRILNELGYESAAFVSSSVLVAGKRGLDNGFTTYDDTLDHVEPQRPDNSSRLSPSLARAVNTWLDRRTQASQPWLLWVHCIDPHGPYNPLPAYEGRFRTERAQLLERALIPPYQWKGTLDYFRYVDAYDEEITQFDTELGPLLTRLSEPPGPRGRIVIFTADHGEQFGEHGSYFMHGNTLHREETHVPLIWLEVGKTVPHRESTPVSLVDIVPTLLERLGVSTTLALDGLTLAQRVAQRAPVYSGYRPGEYAVTHDGATLLRDARREPVVELSYRLADDPKEARPIAPSAALIALLDDLVRHDPIAAVGAAGFERRQWENQTPEDLESLRSLGYVGPAPKEKP